MTKIIHAETKSSRCPRSARSAATKVVRTEGEVDYRCVNANCPAKLLGTILHFASRGVMNIDGMGEALVTQLTERGLVKNVADIYKLTKADLLSLERFADKSAQNILDEIENSKKLPLERVIYGLGIRMVGERTAQFLAEHFGSMEALEQAGVEELQNVNEVGPRIAESIAEFFSIPANRKLVERLGAGRARVQRQEERAWHQARGEDIRADRNAGEVHARRSQEDDRRRRRESHRLGQQENGLRRGGRRCRLEAGQGEGIGRAVIDEKEMEELLTSRSAPF